MPDDLKGKRAIVTGGSKGYGTGIAGVLREKGADVWITGRDEEALKNVAKELDVHAVQADVTENEAWDRLMKEVLGSGDRIDILVNNAGGGIKIGHLDEQSDAEIDESIAVNLTGAIKGCRRVVPVMKRHKSGTIINVSSACAREAWPGWSVYSAAKSGLVQFSRCLYTELREHGVRVTSVIPSWGATDFLKAAHLPEFDSATANAAIQPREIGDLIASICTLPPHLNIEDVTLWPLIQKVEPL
jgi:NADP-dependent 3-hydroxy acid dehydrogenase YdfG